MNTIPYLQIRARQARHLLLNEMDFTRIQQICRYMPPSIFNDREVCELLATHKNIASLLNHYQPSGGEHLNIWDCLDTLLQTWRRTKEVTHHDILISIATTDSLNQSIEILCKRIPFVHWVWYYLGGYTSELITNLFQVLDQARNTIQDGARLAPLERSKSFNPLTLWLLSTTDPVISQPIFLESVAQLLRPIGAAVQASLLSTLERLIVLEEHYNLCLRFNEWSNTRLEFVFLEGALEEVPIRNMVSTMNDQVTTLMEMITINGLMKGQGRAEATLENHWKILYAEIKGTVKARPQHDITPLWDLAWEFQRTRNCHFRTAVIRAILDAGYSPQISDNQLTENLEFAPETTESKPTLYWMKSWRKHMDGLSQSKKHNAALQFASNILRYRFEKSDSASLRSAFPLLQSPSRPSISDSRSPLIEMSLFPRPPGLGFTPIKLHKSTSLQALSTKAMVRQELKHSLDISRRGLHNSLEPGREIGLAENQKSALSSGVSIPDVAPDSTTIKTTFSRSTFSTDTSDVAFHATVTEWWRTVCKKLRRGCSRKTSKPLREKP